MSDQTENNNTTPTKDGNAPAPVSTEATAEKQKKKGSWWNKGAKRNLNFEDDDFDPLRTCWAFHWVPQHKGDDIIDTKAVFYVATRPMGDKFMTDPMFCKGRTDSPLNVKQQWLNQFDGYIVKWTFQSFMLKPNSPIWKNKTYAMKGLGFVNENIEDTDDVKGFVDHVLAPAIATMVPVLNEINGTTYTLKPHDTITIRGAQDIKTRPTLDSFIKDKKEVIRVINFISNGSLQKWGTKQGNIYNIWTEGNVDINFIATSEIEKSVLLPTDVARYNQLFPAPGTNVAPAAAAVAAPGTKRSAEINLNDIFGNKKQKETEAAAKKDNEVYIKQEKLDDRTEEEKQNAKKSKDGDSGTI